MSRFFPVGPFPVGVAARFGAAFFAVIFFAVAFFAVIFLDVAFLLISAPELALDRFTRFRAWRKGSALSSRPRSQPHHRDLAIRVHRVLAVAQRGRDDPRPRAIAL